MDAIRSDQRDADWPALLNRVRSGEAFDITSDGEVIAKVTPPEPPAAREMTPEEIKADWKAAGVDWDEIRRFRESLPFDPTNSVIEMRREARY